MMGQRASSKNKGKCVNGPLYREQGMNSKEKRLAIMQGLSEWERDSLKWRGKILKGKYSHWCPEWDDLPIDETCREWPCCCGIKEHIDGNR
jgi:hypothetical protein